MHILSYSTCLDNTSISCHGVIVIYNKKKKKKKRKKKERKKASEIFGDLPVHNMVSSDGSASLMRKPTTNPTTTPPRLSTNNRLSFRHPGSLDVSLLWTSSPPSWTEAEAFTSALPLLCVVCSDIAVGGKASAARSRSRQMILGGKTRSVFVLLMTRVYIYVHSTEFGIAISVSEWVVPIQCAQGPVIQR